MHRILFCFFSLAFVASTFGQEAAPSVETAQRAAAADDDALRAMQSDAISKQRSDAVHWGHIRDRYSTWTNHSNRLIPVYTFGLTLAALREEGSVYADPKRLEKLYDRVPEGTVNPTAMYYDQTDIYRLQMAAVDAGYSNIILMVFDGMDWQTTRAAALYKTGRVAYQRGRGTGLSFQDFRRIQTDFGLVCTSPLLAGAKIDVDAQAVISAGSESTGGYDPIRGGREPWNEQSGRDYLLGLDREQPHDVTDSASSATSMTCGIKTFNGAINITAEGEQLTPIARILQDEQDFLAGIVTNVPVSHATPAAAYANNVTRKDYQDISRDLIGLPSSSHRGQPLMGVDVLIGGGWGETVKSDKGQGENFVPGNRYLHEDDLAQVDVKNGGLYLVAQRSEGKSGRKSLMEAAQKAADEDHRLIGFYGVRGGHLPFQTADGKYNPTFDVKAAETYSEQDLFENPTLADMTAAALLKLEQAIDGFWLMIEAGDIDWANHSNNIDNSIGAVLSGEAAFDVVMQWIDENNAWSYTAVIITADHGHFLVIDDADRLAEAGKKMKNE